MASNSFLASLLLFSLVASTGLAFKCPTTCQSLNTNLVAKNYTRLPKTFLVGVCVRNAAISKFSYYAFKPQSGLCFGFNGCYYAYSQPGFVAGLVKICKVKLPPPPPPPPAPKTYCSAPLKTKACRCRKPLLCKKVKVGKVCCCPTKKPKPVIRKGKLVGCTK